MGPMRRYWTVLAAALLLTIHVVLAVRSLVRENPTIDEVVHLPAGISYWQRGTFRLYHHNPPLVKLVAALPALAGGVETAPLYSSRFWREEPPNKAGFAHEFALRNAAGYFELFTRARLLMPLFSVVGGIVVFAWSRRLYGDPGGLLSLALWVSCPNILAHCRLVTTDVPATALGVLATYAFWRDLQRPSWTGAVAAGVALGLAQLTKFSLVLLYGLWPLLGFLHWYSKGDRRGAGRRLAQAAILVASSVLVVDAGYAFEGVGRPLGGFDFVSRTLTRPLPPPNPPQPWAERLVDRLLQIRVNRFRGTFLGSLPVPIPAHYLLGFDDQKMEAEGIPERVLRGKGLVIAAGDDGDEGPGYPVYLDGVLSSRSWWSYYFYTLAYKVPEGTWLLVVLSLLVTATSRRARASWFDESTLLAVPAVVLFVFSVFTNINLGLRYVLPIFPYLFISCGKLVPWAAGMRTRLRRSLAGGLIGVGLVATLMSTAAIHPHYLAYFNAASGGPARGSEHLIDSNLDWGQDLVGLRRWRALHAPGERVGLAYFGQINPSIFEARPGEAFDWFLPPPLPKRCEPLPARDRFGPRPTRLEPGLYAVSASLVRGLPWRVYDNTRWAPYEASFEAFSYFRRLRAIARVGESIFVYRVSPADAEGLAPLWAPGNVVTP
jgi:4-amino-4-deoxy-L-arabinose transferase-like glycosyltransferase